MIIRILTPTLSNVDARIRTYYLYIQRQCSAIVGGIFRMLSAILRQLVDIRDMQYTHTHTHARNYVTLSFSLYQNGFDFNWISCHCSAATCCASKVASNVYWILFQQELEESHWQFKPICNYLKDLKVCFLNSLKKK